MGKAQSVLDKSGQIKIFPYPYSYFHKMLQFPYKFHWEYSPFFKVWPVWFFIMYPVMKGAQNFFSYDPKMDPYVIPYKIYYERSHFDNQRPINGFKWKPQPWHFQYNVKRIKGIEYFDKKEHLK